MLMVVQQREPRVSLRLADSQLPSATELLGTCTPADEELTELSLPGETERYYFFPWTFPGILFKITASGRYLSVLSCFPCSFLDSQCSLLRPCHVSTNISSHLWAAATVVYFFDITASGRYRSVLPCFPCIFLDCQCSVLRPCQYKHLQSFVGRRHWRDLFRQLMWLLLAAL